MEVIALAEREGRWRWQIRHNDQIVEESGERFPTLPQAIADGKRHLITLWTGRERPKIARQFQRRPAVG